MTVTLNKKEILNRAYRLMKDYADASYEMGQAQDFIRDLCEVFGFSHKRLVSFEQRVKKLGGARGRIDGFYPGKLLIEMKSRGQDLDAAYIQATEYLHGLKDEELPDYILVSDFAQLRLYRRDGRSEPICSHSLQDFDKHIDAYLFLAGYETQAQAEQIAVNESAARKIADLHDAMRAGGYNGADLERYMVRLLFCLFADDTGIFETDGAFARYIRQHSQLDGSDLDGKLQNLFDTLNRAPDKRPKSLPHELQGFPYINGSVFSGQLERCYFDGDARASLLGCAEEFDWSQISPAIFGSLFQAVIHHDGEGTQTKNSKVSKSSKRRELGAHYTSESNILRVIRPLFLDTLEAELRAAKRNKKALEDFLKKLRQLMFFDPACGCGNFLVIGYREIRRLELEAAEALLAIAKKSRVVSGTLDATQFGQVQCDVHQFHGIEIEASAAHIATVALWLTDHQENQRASKALGGNFTRLPLDKKANIVCANALTKDWASVLVPELCDYVIGNPPFVGAKFMGDEQRADVGRVFGTLHNAGLLDFVAAWYVKAAHYVKANPAVRVAFVSTNSITQGEQVGVLWSWMLAQGMKIQFAHRTFQWSNDAKGVAAVHCVIVGFGAASLPGKTIYQYDDIRGEPLALAAKNINPYLVDAPDVVLPRRSKPICAVPEIGIGNKPIDGGNYLFTTDEKAEFLKLEPGARKFFHRWLGADEFLNGWERWCLWLGDCPASELRAMPEAMKRVQAVKLSRLASKSAPTQKLATTPTRFHVENMPTTPYLVLPEVSSERRLFIPFGFEKPSTLCSNLVKIAPGATLLHFGVLSSTMHNAWVRATCGRMKSDYRYSKDIVYNNYPWPDHESKEALAQAGRSQAAIEIASQAVLDTRAAGTGQSLADLYDPLAMPQALRKAHQNLDKAVDAAYGYKGGADDAARVAFLFTLYQQLTGATATAVAAPAAPAKAGKARKPRLAAA
ncbi:MAG: class I SAM-dependent DNA methyltransferase [Polaromonas sp.]|nr:class I SAM-dependent DNA methyltransferase [Polaromonas sp.]